MALDLTKLENIQKQGTKTIARCPACAETGADEKGEHLVIRSDGRFGCVINPGPNGKRHRQRIFQLVGIKEFAARPQYRITVRKAVDGGGEVLGRFGRMISTPEIAGIDGCADKDSNSGRPGRVFSTLARTRETSSFKNNDTTHTHVRGTQNYPSEASATSETTAIPPEPLLRTSPTPFLPKMGPLIRSLESTDPNFAEPTNGSMLLGLYRDDMGSVTPVVLWAHPEKDLLWDMAAGGFVNPPRFYIPLPVSWPIDPETGHPVINGAVCPF